MVILLQDLKRRFVALVLIVVILVSLMVVIIELTLQPVLDSICQTKITAMLTKLINQAISQQTRNLAYNDLIIIKTNQQGQIILMQPNLQLINSLSSNITLQLQQLLEEQNQQLIQIPLFKIFSIEIFSRYSPKLTVRAIPYGAVSTDIIDEFEAVGINQSRHKIYLKVETRVRVIIPLLGTKIDVATKVPLSEAVIVGQVPEVYVGVEGGLLRTEQQ